MAQEGTDVRQKIILAVINCIEKEGIQSITTRKIAAEAGVNIAAINYYFGSKEKLIDQSFEHINKDVMMDTIQIINNSEKDIKSIINELLPYMFEGCINYPNLLKAIFYGVFINNNYDDRFVKRINDTLEILYKRLEIGVPEEKKCKIKNLLIDAFSSFMFIGLFPDYYREFWGVDLRNEQSKKEYVERIADKLIGDIEGI